MGMMAVTLRIYLLHIHTDLFREKQAINSVKLCLISDQSIADDPSWISSYRMLRFPILEGYLLLIPRKPRRSIHLLNDTPSLPSWNFMIQKIMLFTIFPFNQLINIIFIWSKFDELLFEDNDLKFIALGGMKNFQLLVHLREDDLMELLANKKRNKSTPEWEHVEHKT